MTTSLTRFAALVLVAPLLLSSVPFRALADAPIADDTAVVADPVIVTPALEEQPAEEAPASGEAPATEAAPAQTPAIDEAPAADNAAQTFSSAALVPFAASTLYVDASNAGPADGSETAPYASISAAIAAASAGDTIVVKPGTYQETVVLDKAITLASAGGAAATTIVGVTGNATPVQFATSGATVDGFTITHQYTPAELSAWGDGNTGNDVNNNGVLFNQLTSGNTLKNSVVSLNRNGIYANNASATISGNTITNNRTGLNFTNTFNGMQVTGNTISGNWTLGLVMYTASAGMNVDFSTVTISGNTFDGNWYAEIGIKDMPGSTGTLDVSSNTFTDAPVTYSTSASASFNEPGFDAQKPAVAGVDGTATKPATDLPTLRIYNSGSVVLAYAGKTLKVGASQPFQTVQSAVDAAADGDTVLVEAGTYAEQVALTKSVKLVGAGASTVIQAPASMTDAYGFGKNVVTVNGSGVSAEISDLTVAGPGAGTCNSINTGIFVGGAANATVHDATISNVSDTPLSGCQNGIGIQVGIAGGTTGTATIADNAISGYQKNGIAVKGAGSDATITGNVITGAGGSSVIAQNGIVIVSGSTATITGNTVTGNQYTGANESVGVLLFGAGAVTVSENTLTGNDVGFYTDSASDSAISRNRLDGNVIAGSENDGTATLDVSENWWGSATGPTTSSNPDGRGAAALGSITLDSWCTAADCSTLNTDPAPNRRNGSGGGNGSSSTDVTGSVDAGAGGEVLGAATYNFTANLRAGATGADVNALQQILIDAGFLKIAAPTGFFGPLTMAAVKQFQTAHNIPATGFVGPLTIAALNAGVTPTMSDEERAMKIAALLEAVKELQEELAKLK
jgi:parallel beta-helix repeat protein